MTSLFSRLSLFFFLILLTLGLSTLWISHRSSQNYFLEFTQRINSPIAMYMADNAHLVKDNQADSQALAELSSHVMIINPSVEVYLIDMDGEVIAPRSTTVSDQQDQAASIASVDLVPIHEFLQPESSYPILGTNPRKPGSRSIFSAAPLYPAQSIAGHGQQLGYVYVVLAGEKHRSLLSSLADSYTMKSLYITLAGISLFALFAGLAVFFQLTHRLRRLTLQAGQWQQTMNDLSTSVEHSIEDSYRFPLENSSDTARSTGSVRSQDEIDILSATYESMTTQLLNQFNHLKNSDKNRREFFANISHDLRTPLTTMQSYLETLVLKNDTLLDSDRKKYLITAHKQSVRLKQLVMQLFEFSKLSSGAVVLQSEKFSLLEFTYDCVQQFSLEASRKNIQLSVRPSSEKSREFDVCADIALVQRVFENLLGNALRFTPEGGRIDIQLTCSGLGRVHVAVRDTGSGITDAQLEKLFRRNFPEPSFGQNTNGNGGLGLSIVKQIVELHGGEVGITSDPGVGTLVKFSLPTP